MTNRNPLSVIGGFLDTLNSAIAVAASTNNGRNPRSRDLRALGIEPEQFRRIRRF